jgi:hypothetical protein
MVAGWYTLKLMETNVYDWSGATEPKRGRIRRFVNRCVRKFEILVSVEPDWEM